LQLRRALPDTFLLGGYHPVLAAGTAADHVVAFLRGDDVLVAVTRWTVHLEQSGWDDTAVSIPEGGWTDVLTGAVVTGRVQAAELFAELPVVLLERTDG
jgi:(1->4)-alpha-D-glucan 1-alpha-D-glucosylmutase